MADLQIGINTNDIERGTQIIDKSFDKIEKEATNVSKSIGLIEKSIKDQAKSIENLTSTLDKYLRTQRETANQERASSSKKLIQQWERKKDLLGKSTIEQHKYKAALELTEAGEKEMIPTVNKLIDEYNDKRKALDRVTTSTEKYQRAIKTVQSSGKRFNSLLKNTSVIVGSLAAGYGGSRLLSHMAKFERSMTRIDAITDVSNETLEEARDLIRELGETTEFRASQAAKGLELLKMGGLDMQQSMEALPRVLDLATSAQIEFARAADIATNVMGQFQLRAEELSRVNDVLAEVQATSNTRIERAATAFEYAGDTARRTGVNIEELGGMIGILANNGIKGQRAGRMLRNAFLQLRDPTNEMKEIYQEFGIVIDDQKEGMRSSINIMRQIADSEMRQIDITRILNKETASIGILFEQIANGNLPAYIEQLDNADKANQKMAATIRDDVQGSMDKLASVVEAVGISAWEEYKDDINDFILDLRGTIKKHEDDVVEFFGGITKSLTDMKNEAKPAIDSIINTMGGLFELFNKVPAELVGPGGIGLVGTMMFGPVPGVLLGVASMLSNEYGKFMSEFEKNTPSNIEKNISNLEGYLLDEQKLSYLKEQREILKKNVEDLEQIYEFAEKRGSKVSSSLDLAENAALLSRIEKDIAEAEQVVEQKQREWSKQVDEFTRDELALSLGFDVDESINNISSNIDFTIDTIQDKYKTPFDLELKPNIKTDKGFNFFEGFDIGKQFEGIEAPTLDTDLSKLNEEYFEFEEALIKEIELIGKSAKEKEILNLKNEALEDGVDKNLIPTLQRYIEKKYEELRLLEKTEAYDKVISKLDEKQKLLGMNELQQKIYNNALEAGIDFEDELTKKEKERYENIKKSTAALYEMIQVQKQAEDFSYGGGPAGIGIPTKGEDREWAEEKIDASKIAKESLKDLRVKEDLETFFDGIDLGFWDKFQRGGKNALEKIREEITLTQEDFDSFVYDSLSSVNTFFDEWITGAKSTEEAFNDMAKSILLDIGEILAKKAAMEAMDWMSTDGGNFSFGGHPSGGTTDDSGGMWSNIIGSVVQGIFSSEHGNVVSGISDYSNKIVDSPTFVPGAGKVTPYATGGALFGEAGPEAIMPLARTSSGDLGVKTQNTKDRGITVYNNFYVTPDEKGNVSKKSQQQIARSAGQGINKAMGRH